MSVDRKYEPETGFHGGDLADAMGHEARADSAQWLDLSTGINPRSYPVPELPAEAWTRLPGRDELGALIAAAAVYYGAPGADTVVAGPGSQALIQTLPAALPDAPVQIAGPAYSGHACAWAAAERTTQMRAALDDCAPEAITVVVNPNNPDGRVIPPEELVEFAEDCTRAGGWLVVDEAFCDVMPDTSIAARCGKHNLIVLKSFGKFFGLAGLRLGFAIAPEAMARRLRRLLGPWAVSGAAIHIGARALGDTVWQQAQRATLEVEAARLDALLGENGFTVIGGTSLFRLAQTPRAARLYAHLLERHIYTRRFGEHPEWLRFGLPGGEDAWRRLDDALSSLAP